MYLEVYPSRPVCCLVTEVPIGKYVIIPFKFNRNMANFPVGMLLSIDEDTHPGKRIIMLPASLGILLLSNIRKAETVRKSILCAMEVTEIVIRNGFNAKYVLIREMESCVISKKDFMLYIFNGFIVLEELI